MIQTLPSTVRTKVDPLGNDVRAVHAELRASIARVFAALGTTIVRPRDLRNALDLHQTLAWKILRIVQTADPLGDIQYIPGSVGIETFLTAAEEKGVPQEALAEVRAAFSRFRSLIDSRAGDRASLELMLGGLREEEHGGSGDWRSLRRAGFRCASSTWGVQIRTRLLCEILAPSQSDPDLMDMVLMPASLGMRRIKPGAIFPLHPASPIVVVDNDGEKRNTPQTAVLDPESIPVGMPLLPRFCSKPFPEVRIGHRPDGSREYQLGEVPVGGRNGIDMFFGMVHRAVASRYRDEHNAYSNTAATIRIPIETAVVDVWVHDDLLPKRRPRALLYGELSRVPWHDQQPDSAERLSMSETVETMGRGLANAPLLEAPQYREAVEFAFSRLGWNPEKFTLYRLRVEFPVIATALVVQFDLPERPV